MTYYFRDLRLFFWRQGVCVGGGGHTDERIVRNRLAGAINSDVTSLKYDVALSAQITSSVSYLTSVHNSEVESCILDIIETGT